MHVLADALTSVLAIAALLLGRYFGWVWTDPVMGLVGSGVGLALIQTSAARLRMPGVVVRPIRLPPWPLWSLNWPETLALVAQAARDFFR